MPALIHLLAAFAAAALVLALTWKKAGVPRTLLAWALGTATGVFVFIWATKALQHQDIAFAPSEMLSPFLGAFIAAIFSNRRAHRLKELDQS